jgi:ATP-dependent DNA helicase RecQ
MLLTDESDHPPRVVFTVSRDDLYKIQVDRQELDYFIRVLLRTYTGIFSDFVPINEHEIAHLSGYDLDRVRELLKRLWQLRIIRYIPGNRSAMILFLNERLEENNLRISPQSYRIRKEVAQQRLDAMIGYAENRSECRSLLLQRYFGEQADDPCGRCDICRDKRKAARDEEGQGSEQPRGTSLRDRILETLSTGGQSLHEVVAALRGDLPAILDEIRALTAAGLIVQKPDGTIVLRGSASE